MSADQPMQVVLCWHMHQPSYRDELSGRYHLPWTYLHAIKDYTDMAAHLEACPGARAVVNFAPILLEQLDDYGRQIQSWLAGGGAISDPLLAALAAPVLPHDPEAQLQLIRDCLRANRERLIRRFPRFDKLATLAEYYLEHPDALDYLQDQYVTDLLVWYHLAWIGETVRRDSPLVTELMQQERHFSLHQRRQLLGLIGELISGIIPRYRTLAEQGRVELSMTPYAHPIVPLLLDLNSTREAMPEAPMPALKHYPGGEERARWHILRGLQVFEHYFGFRPAGCWPSEGSVSEATVALLGEYDFRWLASGENVFRNSEHKSGEQGPGPDVHRVFRLHGKGPACFFRDDGLSDLVGFTYSDWHGDDAVANLVHHLENIHDNSQDAANTVVSIVLDGENAWEYYPENGYYFLNALYQALSTNDKFQLGTFSSVLDNGTKAAKLPQLVAGSWVYGSFSTWIGETDKNRGWDMLGDLKAAWDQALAEDRLDPQTRDKALQQLAICEGSDWFWWFGDYNPEESVSSFESLYRCHLANMYQLIAVEPPEYLSHAFTRGKGAPAAGGVMRTGSAG